MRHEQEPVIKDVLLGNKPSAGLDYQKMTNPGMPTKSKVKQE